MASCSTSTRRPPGKAAAILVAVDRWFPGPGGRRARRRAREVAAAELAARAAEPPVYRPDGLVAERPLFADTDDAMFRNYRWVAMLDPVELADGRDPDGVDPGPWPGTVVGALAVVDHHGRPAWEAVVRALPTYQPRCGCCSLLRDPVQDEREWGRGGPPNLPAGYVYGEGARVRLDRATGICVRLEQIGGTDAGAGFEAVIEAVDVV